MGTAEIIEEIFAELLAAITDGLPLKPLIASSGEPLPADFAVITATNPAAPDPPPGLTWEVSLSINIPIERRDEAELLAATFLALSLPAIAGFATSLFSGIQPGHFYSWSPSLAETDLTEGDRLILTATGSLTCARFVKPASAS
ncbi:MAG: hypothetical protein ACI4RT_09400 [Candidatus Spyradenecus sp.]